MTNSFKAACVMKALVTAYVITGILLVILAFGVYKLELTESTVNLCIIFIYVIASFIGAFSLGKMIKEKKFLWGALLGIVYIAIIIIVSAIAEGNFSLAGSEFISAFLLCFGGGTLGGMLS